MMSDPNVKMESKMQPSGPHGDDPAAAGPAETHLVSHTPENLLGELNPSSPGNTGTTPGTDW